MTELEEAMMRESALKLAVGVFGSCGSTNMIVNVAKTFEYYIKTGNLLSEETKSD